MVEAVLAGMNIHSQMQLQVQPAKMEVTAAATAAGQVVQEIQSARGGTVGHLILAAIVMVALALLVTVSHGAARPPDRLVMVV